MSASTRDDRARARVAAILAETDPTQQCAAPRCTERFDPAQGRHGGRPRKFCSRYCSQTARRTRDAEDTFITKEKGTKQ